MNRIGKKKVFRTIDYIYGASQVALVVKNPPANAGDKRHGFEPQVRDPWNSPGQNNGVGRLSLLQGIIPSQESNPGLPHCRQTLYQLSHREAVTNPQQTLSSVVKN